MGAHKMYGAVRRILRWQIWAIVLAGSAAAAWGGWLAARSALIGGAIGFIPNAYFAVRFGFADPGRTAKEVVRAFYAGEAVKLLTTALLFVLAFQLPDLWYLPLFVGFSAVLMVYWFALLLSDNNSDS